MFSVVIATHDQERALLRTLAALVPGAVAGVVHEVILADDGTSEAMAQIAEAAGCRILTTRGARGARLRSAVAAARAEWLLFLWPGFLPDADWIEQTRWFIEATELRSDGENRAALFAARHIYECAGFILVGSKKHNEFGKEVIGETWELML